MKKYFTFLSLLILLFNSCTKEEPIVEEPTTNNNNNSSNTDPVFGDTSITQLSFPASQTLLFNSSPQYYPSVIATPSFATVIWGENSTPRSIKLTNLTSSNISDGVSYDVFDDCGNINSADSYNHAVQYDPNSGKLLSVYFHAHNNTTTVEKDFSLKAKLYSTTDQSDSSFYIEGPFDYSSDAPNRPSVAVSFNSIFAVVYHSNSNVSTSSKIKVKLVNANTKVVTPKDTANVQNGIELSPTGALHPSVAWNSNSNVFGVVYVTGSGTNVKIKYLSFDETGTIVTAPKDLIYTGKGLAFPKIKADGNNFIIAWQDFRNFKLGEEPEMAGTPAIRISQIDANGDFTVLNGMSDLFDANDNSLILSNPYETEAYIHFDIVVQIPGQKYGIVWATQVAPYKIQFAEVINSNSFISSSIPVDISEEGVHSDRPSIGFSNGKYIIVFNGHTGTTYENKISSNL